MKGVIFTEFMEMVENTFSMDMVDDIIDDAQPASGGAYTAVGTYDHQEMVNLVVALSRRSGIAVPELLKAFGSYLFGRFVINYPAFFVNKHDALDFLMDIEDIIHPEVLKLYPDAELPRFDVDRESPNRLTLVYRSQRHFEDVADGLIQGCIQHFGGAITVSREVVDDSGVPCERFVLTREA